MIDLINYIKTHLNNHTHKDIALQVIELLDYIEHNLDEVSQYSLNKALFIHPKSNLAIHLNAYSTPEMAKEGLLRIIDEFKSCVKGLLAIEDETVKQSVIDIFLLNINDSKVGCMEVRLRPAFEFAAVFQSIGVLPIDNLMQQYYEKTSMHQQSVEGLLDFFANLDLSQGSWLVKSIRWDENNFLDNFLLGITKSPDNQHHEALRNGKHKQYTVFESGVYPYAEKPSPYPFEGESLSSKKAKRSQHQSCSFITPHLRSPVFGFSKERRNKLVGFVFDSEDALINRIFKYDGGTYDRPYETDSLIEAQNYYEEKVLSWNAILFNSLEALEKNMVGNTVDHNEVTARLRYKTQSNKVQQSGIALFSDSFEARCIAQYYANQLVKKLKNQFHSKKHSWDSSYQVPITHYLPGSHKDNAPYTPEEQQNDRIEAERIIQDLRALNIKLGKRNYEFLLLIEPLKLVQFLLKKPSILQTLLKKNQWQLIEAFVEITEQNPQLLDLIKENNQYLSLINLLKCRHAKLAKLVIKQCDPNINVTNEYGTTPLGIAAKNGDLDIVKALLSKGANIDTTTNKYGSTPLDIAKHYNHKEIIDVLNKMALNNYLEKIKLRADDNYNNPLDQFCNNQFNFSFFGYCAKEKREAAIALKNVIENGAEIDSLEPHRGALNQGRLGSIYSNF